jgi:hypothetical protein
VPYLVQLNMSLIDGKKRQFQMTFLSKDKGQILQKLKHWEIS